MLKRAVCDLQGKGWRWTSKCDNIRGTSITVSLKRDENLQVFTVIRVFLKAIVDYVGDQKNQQMIQAIFVMCFDVFITKLERHHCVNLCVHRYLLIIALICATYAIDCIAAAAFVFLATLSVLFIIRGE